MHSAPQRFIMMIIVTAFFFSLNAMEAYRAYDFIESMGICVKVFDDARHDTIVKPRLQELGIRHLRVKLKRIGDNVGGNGEIQLQRIKGLGESGFKITGLTHCWYTMKQFHTIISYLTPNSIYQIEGPNEPWHANENFSWENQGWPMGPILFMEDLDSMLQSDPSTSSIPVLSYSGTTTSYGSIEQWIDYGNEHIYPINGKGISQGNELQNKIDRCRATQSPTKPLQFTETGYNSGSGYQPTSLWTQTRGVPRLFLEGFRHGLKRFFLYALMVSDDAGFSLLQTDGTPKPAYHAVKNMITILRDTDSTHHTRPLDIGVICEVASVHSLLLQKGDGTYFLCLWNDSDGWNEQSTADIDNPEVPATITFNADIERISLFRPVTNGAIACDSLIHPEASVAITVPDHPIIMRIELTQQSTSARIASTKQTLSPPASVSGSFMQSAHNYLRLHINDNSAFSLDGRRVAISSLRNGMGAHSKIIILDQPNKQGQD